MKVAQKVVTTRLASYQENRHSTRERQENPVHIGREEKKLRLTGTRSREAEPWPHLPFLGLRFTNLSDLSLHFYILSYPIIIRGCRRKN
jgi:hypothetical protein